MRRHWIKTLLAVGILLRYGAAQASVTLEIHQDYTTYNLQSVGGVPISSTQGDPPGSNGHMPTGVNESGSLNNTTAGQFMNLLSIGGSIGLQQSQWLAVSNSAILNAGTTPLSAIVADEMQLPVGKSNNVTVMIMSQAQIGAPFLNRPVSFLFGSVIPVVETDENGILLTNVAKETYWLPEPYDATNSTSYYWSPHAQQVYATQPGPVSITWIKSTPYTLTTVPANYSDDTGSYGSFFTNGGNVYLLHTTTYIVAGSPAKTPRKIFWNQKSFQNVGKTVSIPTTTVRNVNIVYNNTFPVSVSTEYTQPGYVDPTTGTTYEGENTKELRTLWYDNGNLNAYNAEGRVFIELLGDVRADKTQVQLGYEIVDVSMQATPSDVTTELGERLTPPSPGTLDTLSPEPLNQTSLSTTTYGYQHNLAGSDTIELYAASLTQNLNDYLVYWMETGIQGIKWPAYLARYALVWPTDITKYNQYIRPVVTNETEAAETAIELDSGNLPAIQYQDPLDTPRAKITSDTKFYTYLDSAHPIHRTLLRFTSGNYVSFERVYSWLNSTLTTTNYAGTTATNLAAWDPTSQTMTWPEGGLAPRLISGTINVGERISTPDGELGNLSDYFPGHINATAGTLFNPDTYLDPFVYGFDVAAAGAIIPVNAIPGKNKLEVWWFRADNTSAGPNVGDTEKGFTTAYWPSVIGQYTIQYPTNAGEIVLASKLGAKLNTYQSQGSVYRQNDTNEFGYNPNEEHAILSGDAVYATRDDLNITNGTTYSSMPVVLVEFIDADGRPSMSVFNVVRERPDLGYVFDYVATAGQVLTPPMPLPLLGKPVTNSINYNTEPDRADGDLPGSWNASRDSQGIYSNYVHFTYRDRNDDFWVYRGVHSGIPVLQVGTYNPAAGTFSDPPNATAILGTPFTYTLHASRQSDYLTTTIVGDGLEWLTAKGLVLSGTPTNTGTFSATLIVSDPYQTASVTNTISIQVVASGTAIAQEPLVLSSTNSDTGVVVTFTNRPPFLAMSPMATNSFTMRYYYKTLNTFDWPGVVNPPPAGTVVPYLRPWNSTSGSFVGDPASKQTASLEIVYRPVWPESQSDGSTIPTMKYGYTLTTSRYGLPDIKDMKTVRVLYQQSVAANITTSNSSVVLFDPTREKTADLSANGLTELPAGIYTQEYNEKTYFPNLPPHLVNRVYFDPNRGTNGALVLTGVFNEESDLENYLLLNILRNNDLTIVDNLCPTSDADYQKWTNTVASLSTDVETYWESTTTPGTYVANTNWTVSVSVENLAEVRSDETPVDSYALTSCGPGSGFVTIVENGGAALTDSEDFVNLHIFQVSGSLYSGELKTIASDNPLSEQLSFQHTGDLGGRTTEYEYQWKIAAPVDGMPPSSDASMSQYLSLTNGMDIPRYVLGGAGVQALSDNYVVMRYRPLNPNHPLYKNKPTDADWSAWTTPVLAEGWIKRVLAGINPFNQRTTDLFNNSVNTDVSMLTQAGTRWEGDIALNSDSINNYGLIAIYETVLRRGKTLSIDAGYNYGPANQALLLAAGYLSDLYTMEGNEAWADAANPTIGIGTKDKTYGDIATSMFSFEGQVSSLLEEELALLRGRDDSLQPGVETAPVYNRLVWNYTRGIDDGEVIYAINYNIQPQPGSTSSSISASDAAYMYPQGHGDAYGHYLTALMGYYSLLLNSCFDWVPQTEAVTVLGMPVQVNYQHERKFAAAAVDVAKSGLQIFDLTWRRDYQQVHKEGWSQYEATSVNDSRDIPTTNYWALDQWASRTEQGAYLNWVVGNAILPDHDTNAAHTGIQKVDRTTVTELLELPKLASSLQTDMDNADAGISPLGVPQDGIAFDIDPNAVLGSDGQTHFEQIYNRTLVALNNAVTSFNDAKDVTALMRSEQDSLTEFQASVESQERAYTNQLIELFGTPYTDDIGVGKTYKQGYAGPDLVHFTYVDIVESTFGGLLTPEQTQTNYIDIQQFPSDWASVMYTNVNFIVSSSSSTYTVSNAVQFIFGPHGFFDKPSSWTGKRESPGKIQQAISDLIKAHDNVSQALSDAEGAKTDLDKAVAAFNAQTAENSYILLLGNANEDLENAMNIENSVYNVTQKITDTTTSILTDVKDAIIASTPDTAIFGTANGGNLAKAAYISVYSVYMAGKTVLTLADAATFSTLQVGLAVEQSQIIQNEKAIANEQYKQSLETAVLGLSEAFEALSGNLTTINQRLRAYDDAQRAYQALVAEGDRIQEERQTFRQHAAQIIQGYRTRDAAFRIFRNEKLERYKTLFDLAARYSLMAANAYDYETGLLNTDSGRAFITRIINSRALGVVTDGQPQYAGSDTGDPGLSSALAEMKADWDVVRGRLGFNNPDAYGTTASLRTENLRILPGTDGDSTWKDYLQKAKVNNILDDSDVLRYCMQVDAGDGLPVPGLIITFSTTIADGENLFGQALAAGDHAFSPSSFATKIFAVGVDFEGYRGMDDPSGTNTTTSQDTLALAATPYVYLIPVGVDSMRTPPLGDVSTIRTWTVNDVAIPMPFNIGDSGYSSQSLWQSSDSLSESLFATRKHQAFRPVSSVSCFTTDLYTSGGSLKRSQFTNNRLIGRSAWNSQWKLVIPGRTLLDDPNEGLSRFIQTVSDIKLHFVTYSYSGN